MDYLCINITFKFFCRPCSLFCKSIFSYLVLHESALYDEN